MNTWINGLIIIFYVAAIGSSFITKNSKVWAPLIAIGILLAVFAGYLSLISLPFLFLIFAITYYYNQTKRPVSKVLFGLGFIVITAMTLLNKIPGVDNWKVIDEVLLTPDAFPLTLYFGFDSALIGLAIMLFGIPTISNKAELKKCVKVLSLLVPVMLGVVISFSIGLDYVKWHPKWTPLFFIWSVSNLFFTCVIEETIFRHFIQNGLQNTFVAFKYGDALGLILASFLFGLAHYAGGILYVFLASIAGLFYGGAYYVTGRIEASIASHYILNATHFLFFTYPVLASALS